MNFSYRKNISLIALCALNVLISKNVFAQTITTQETAAPAAAAPSNFTFSPSIWVGARSNIIAHSNSKHDASTIGPFVKPGFQVKYSSSPISLSTKYTFEASAAKGFESQGTNNSVSNNTYYQHEPIFLFSGKANDVSKINLFGDLWINTENKRTQNTFYELTIQPDFEYQINSALTVAVGYQLFRKNYFDTTVTSESTGSSAGLAQTAKPKKPAFAAVTPEAGGQNPLTTLHAGIITTNTKIGASSLLAYFRGGRQVSTIAGKAGLNYRLNADFSTPITSNLSTQLRYRFHLEDYDAAKAYYYNRARVILSYALSKAWSTDIQNTLTIEKTTADNNRVKYTNENYAGVTYKF